MKEQRTRKFINGWVQVRIAIEIVTYAVLMLALVVWVLFAPPFVTWFSSYGILDHQSVASDLIRLNASKWPLFLVLAVFVGFVSVLFSHHIVGPSYQLKMIFSQMAERNLKIRARFRKWDYLIENEKQLNQAIERLQEDMASVLKNSQDALGAFREMRIQLGNSEKVQDLEKSLNALENLGRSYQL